MKKYVLISVAILMVFSACSLLPAATPTVDPVAQAIAQTMAVQNAAATLIAQSQPLTQPTAGPVPTVAVAPTVAPIPTNPPPTAVPAVKVTATKNANCRSGPGGNFDYLGVLNLGETANVLGKNLSHGTWWKVTLASSGKECWVTGDAVTLSGDANTVPLLVSPPTPTPVPPPNWNGLWNMGISMDSWDPTYHFVPFTTTMTQTGNSVYFNFTTNGINFSVSGTVSPNGLQFNGYLTQAGTSSKWAILMVRSLDKLDQIKGRWNVVGSSVDDGNFCGYKNGAGFPSPCRP
jgi:uncharacterized protein YgiM (DUF1202 family)